MRIQSGDTLQNNIIENELNGISLASPTSGTVQTTTVSGNQFLDNQVAIDSTLGLLNAKISNNTFMGDVQESVDLDGASQSNVQIVNNQLTNDAPITLVNTAASTIINNVINNPDGDAIFLAGNVTGADVSKNQLSTTIAASLTSSDGIDVEAVDSATGNTGNRLGLNMINGFDVGIYVDAASTGNTFAGNTVESSSDDGIDVFSDGDTLNSNTANDNDGDGIGVFIDSTPTPNGSVTLAGNTTEGNSFEGDLPGGRWHGDRHRRHGRHEYFRDEYRRGDSDRQK